MTRFRTRIRATEDIPEFSLHDQDVHLWFYLYQERELSELKEAYFRLLGPDEKDRYARLKLPEHRRQYLATRALCRWALSRYAPVRPADWRFQSGPLGKPSIAAPAISPPIWFNLSHADDLSVCVVSRATEFVGVDIETIDPKAPHLDIAASFFPPAEVEILRSLAPDRVSEAFVCRWTLKESFVKAREVDLGSGLADATFDLSDPSDISVSFAGALNEQSANWCFELRRLADTRILALAVRSGRRAPLRLRMINCIPEQGILPFPADFGVSC